MLVIVMTALLDVANAYEIASVSGVDGVLTAITGPATPFPKSNSSFSHRGSFYQRGESIDGWKSPAASPAPAAAKP